MNEKFQKIGDEERGDLKDIILMAHERDCTIEKIDGEMYKYVVTLQYINFVTYMTEDEVEMSVEKAIDLMEEMKEINNGGLDRKKFTELLDRLNKEYDNNEALVLLRLWKEIASDRLNEIVSEIDELRRVGGAYAMLVSNPCLESAIRAVYERMVDNFDDDGLYNKALYFLFRAVLRVHSEEIKKEPNEEV